MKSKREYRAGIGIWHGQGLYFYAKSKREAYNIAIRMYMRRYSATRAKAKKEIKMRNVRVWRNADNSMPAWRKKLAAKKKRAKARKR